MLRCSQLPLILVCSLGLLLRKNSDGHFDNRHHRLNAVELLRRSMAMTEKNVAVSYEIRVAPGAAGNDPEAPAWQVCELENGVIKNDADIYDNLTLAEAEQIVGMWIK